MAASDDDHCGALKNVGSEQERLGVLALEVTRRPCLAARRGLRVGPRKRIPAGEFAPAFCICT